MEIKVNRTTFVQALNDIMPFVPAKAPMQILKNAKITTKGSKMKLEANNAQDSISVYIDTLECSGDGSFCVDAADLARYVGATKGIDIGLTVTADAINVRHTKGAADFPVVSADEFPSFKMPEDGVTELVIPANHISECVGNASIFVAKDTIRPHMCAIFATVKDGAFVYAASDTHKLIRGQKSVDNTDADVSFYIVPSAFKSLTKACKTATDASISISDTKVSYRMGDTVINTVQVKGRYPDVQRVIPTQHVFDIKLERDELLDTLKRVSMFCGDSRCARLKICPMDMIVSADDIQTAKKASESVLHGGTASELTIGMNADYLADILSVMNSGEIRMAFTDTSRPAVLTQESKPNVTVIIMPMQITGE